MLLCTKTWPCSHVPAATFRASQPPLDDRDLPRPVPPLAKHCNLHRVDDRDPLAGPALDPQHVAMPRGGNRRARGAARGHARAVGIRLRCAGRRATENDVSALQYGANERATLMDYGNACAGFNDSELAELQDIAKTYREAGNPIVKLTGRSSTTLLQIGLPAIAERRTRQSIGLGGSFRSRREYDPSRRPAMPASPRYAKVSRS